MCIRVRSCCFGCVKLKSGVALMAKIVIFITAIATAFAIKGGNAYNIFANVLALTTNSLLLIGVYRKNRYLALPWLVVDLVGFVMSFYYIGYVLYHVIGVQGKYEEMEAYMDVSVDTSKMSVAERRAGFKKAVTSFLLSLGSSNVLGLYLFMIVYSYYRELSDEDAEANQVFTPDCESRSASRAGGRSLINLTVRGGGGSSNGNVMGGVGSSGRISRNVYAPEPTPGASIYPAHNGSLKSIVAAAELSPQSQMMLPPPQPPPQQQQFMHPMQRQQQQPYVMNAQYMAADPNGPPPAYNYGGYYCPS